MTRVTFGVSPSSFAANMSVKRNALDHALEFPKAADAVERSFYVDDCLAGANSVEEAVDLHQQLFAKGGFLLRKWNSSDPVVLCNISPELRDMQSTHHIPSPDEYTKTLGMPTGITFTSVASLPNTANVTKQTLTSDIAKTFDILGWFSPKIGWDNLLPPTIYQSWLQWRSEWLKDTFHVAIVPEMLMSTQLDFAMLQKMRMLELCTSMHKIDVGTCIFL